MTVDYYALLTLVTAYQLVKPQTIQDQASMGIDRPQTQNENSTLVTVKHQSSHDVFNILDSLKSDFNNYLYQSVWYLGYYKLYSIVKRVAKGFCYQ